MKDNNKLICSKCKRPFNFFIHECSKAIGEYLGCSVCDNYCTKCKDITITSKKKGIKNEKVSK